MLRPECQNGNECSDPGSEHCICARMLPVPDPASRSDFQKGFAAAITTAMEACAEVVTLAEKNGLMADASGAASCILRIHRLGRELGL